MLGFVLCVAWDNCCCVTCESVILVTLYVLILLLTLPFSKLYQLCIPCLLRLSYWFMFACFGCGCKCSCRIWTFVFLPLCLFVTFTVFTGRLFAWAVWCLLGRVRFACLNYMCNVHCIFLFGVAIDNYLLLALLFPLCVSFCHRRAQL